MSERLGWGRDRDIAVQDWSAERSAQIRGGRRSALKMQRFRVRLSNLTLRDGCLIFDSGGGSIG